MYVYPTLSKALTLPWVDRKQPSPDIMNTKQTMNFIQGLRGLAALLVVLWHASRYLGPYGTGLGGKLFLPAGTMGVDLFFIISGFIMYHTTRNSDGSAKYCMAFLIKRFTRIFPLWLIAVVVYVASKHDLSFLTDHDKLKWVVRSVFFIPAHNNLVPPANPPVFSFPVLSVGWTLNYEMYFYLFFAVVMLFGRQRWVALGAWVTITLFILPAVASPQFSFTHAVDADSTQYFSRAYLNVITSPEILLFVAGVLIGGYFHSTNSTTTSQTAYVLIALTTILALSQYAFQYRIGHGMLQWGLSLIPLLTAYAMASKQIDLSLPNWLVYLGDLSFSLYVWHPAVQEGFDDIAARLALGKLSSGWAAMAITTIASIAIAALSHRYIERKLCEMLKSALLAINQKGFRLAEASSP